MAVSAIPVDQRVIDIDSRRFASVEKALVELLTNSDDSYSRLEAAGKAADGGILVGYERHQAGARLVVVDQAEGMTFRQARNSLSYGGAHSPLARGEGGGRGYFGRGLKQAIYGLGYGWIETIRNGRYSRIDLFRSDDGQYLFDDGESDRSATKSDRARLGIRRNGTRVVVVVDNPRVTISRFQSVSRSVANNVYLRELLERRQVELVHLQDGREVERSGPVRFEEPPASVLLGPDAAGTFAVDGTSHPFSITLKRARGAELTAHGDERTNGLVVVSGTAVLDCSLFDYENQLGTEYLFGSVSCPALIEKLGEGVAVISDEREGLNPKEPLVEAFSRAVSRMIAPFVLKERDKLKYIDHAVTSNRTSSMIEHLLDRMNRAAVQDLHVAVPHGEPGPVAPRADDPAALRFSTPFYLRRPDHAFHVRLLVDPEQLGPDEVLKLEYALPDSMEMDTMPREIPVSELGDGHSFRWTVTGNADGEKGEIQVHSHDFWAWCELVISAEASAHHHGQGHHGRRAQHPAHHHGLARDHGEAMFVGYDFRNLGNDLDRAVYSPEERMVLINTGAPTVRLYVDGRGHFRDSARLLLAELFMDVISDELARLTLEKPGQRHDEGAHRQAKLDIIRRYGSDIHQSFLGD